MSLDKNIPILVNLEGDVYFHVEKIIEKIYDGTAAKYQYINPNRYSTIINAALRPRLKSAHLPHQCFFGASLVGLIDDAEEGADGWFNAAYTKKTTGDTYKLKIDIVYYDEFVFLYKENLIKFDDVKFINDDNEEIFVPYTEKLETIDNYLGVFE